MPTHSPSICIESCHPQTTSDDTRGKQQPTPLWQWPHAQQADSARKPCQNSLDRDGTAWTLSLTFTSISTSTCLHASSRCAHLEHPITCEARRRHGTISRSAFFKRPQRALAHHPGDSRLISYTCPTFRIPNQLHQDSVRIQEAWTQYM